jgi:hypothetical protein
MADSAVARPHSEEGAAGSQLLETGRQIRQDQWVASLRIGDSRAQSDLVGLLCG